MVIEFLTLVVFFALLSLAYVSGRRMVLSQSVNAFGYAFFCLIATLATFTTLGALLQGNEALVQGVISFALLMTAWIVVRIATGRKRVYNRPAYLNRSTYYVGVPV